MSVALPPSAGRYENTPGKIYCPNPRLCSFVGVGPGRWDETIQKFDWTFYCEARTFFLHLFSFSSLTPSVLRAQPSLASRVPSLPQRHLDRILPGESFCPKGSADKGLIRRFRNRNDVAHQMCVSSIRHETSVQLSVVVSGVHEPCLICRLYSVSSSTSSNAEIWPPRRRVRLSLARKPKDLSSSANEIFSH